MNRKRLLKSVGLFVLAMLLLALVVPIQAQDIRAGDQVLIAAGETVSDDMIVTGSFVTVDGIIEGDLLAFGSTILIGASGVVEGDLIAAGQSVIIEGTVQDDARIAGAALRIDSRGLVGDDLLAAGYSLETKPGSEIGGDVLYAGGQALLAGAARADVTVGTGGLDLQGSVGGDLSADVGTPADTMPFSPLAFMPDAPVTPSVVGGLTIGPEATIGGDLTYSAEQEFAIPGGSVGGQVNWQRITVKAQEEKEQKSGTTRFLERVLSWFWKNLRNLITLLLIGVLMAWLVPGFLRKGGRTLEAEPLPSLGWGVVTYVGVFFAAMVIFAVTILLALFFGVLTLGKLSGLMVSVGLILLAVLFLLFHVATAFVTKILVSYVGGRLILSKLEPSWNETLFWPVIAGVIVLAILQAIPILGWLVNALVIFMGLGVLSLLAWRLIRGEPTAESAADAEAEAA